MTTRAVLFDFYGTLARATAWGPTFSEVLTARGLVLSQEAHAHLMAEVADGVEHAEHSVDRERYVAWERGRLGRFVEGCGVPPPDVGDIVEALYSAQKDFTLEAYEEVPGVLRSLRDRGVTVAVCSNWDWDLDRAMSRAGLDGLADVVVTSAQAGARKPHPRIYRHTLARCGLDGPGEALFVGDTWEPDVAGPRAYGMRSIHVWRGEPERGAPPSADGFPRIADLAGVLAHL